MVKSLILIWAAPAIALGSPANSQAPAAPKPVSRADFIKKLDAQFNALDTNHDGSVTKAELQAAEQRALELRAQAEFKQLDTNHDGQLNLQEFMAGAPTQKVGEILDQALRQLDSNKDGKIAPEEFRAPQLATFEKLDADHDGVVTPAEIQAYAKAHPRVTPPAR
jgi:Ca2+-binding EF-hand superfamily protein